MVQRQHNHTAGNGAHDFGPELLASPRSTRPALAIHHVVSRIAAALLGGYAFVWGVTTFGITALVALGVGYDEARTTLMLLAFLVFLGVFLWAFAAASLARVWLVLAGSGVALTAAAWALQRFIA
jgi:hypothetical protein